METHREHIENTETCRNTKKYIETHHMETHKHIETHYNTLKDIKTHENI